MLIKSVSLFIRNILNATDFNRFFIIAIPFFSIVSFVSLRPAVSKNVTETPLISTLDSNPLSKVTESQIELPNLDKLKQLDEYIPDNEWNIDSEDIEMDDLLDIQLSPVNYPVLIPINNENSDNRIYFAEE